MNVQVLTLDGVLDRDTVDHAANALVVAVRRRAPLVIDLHRLRSVDGAGAAALKLGVSRAENAEMPLAVVRPESLHVMRRLREAQVDPGHTFSGTVSKAIEAVSPRWRPDGSRWIPTASTPISSGDEA